MIHGLIFDFKRTLFDPDTNKLIPGAINLLQNLKRRNYKLCLLTKKPQEGRLDQISQLGLDKYFLYIGIVEENKTEQDMQACLKAMSLSASEVAVVGDRIRSELALGKRMGMKTIWYQVGKFANELPLNSLEDPDHTITKLEDAAKYV
jgi:FMN phosphatase YigB (HAD superfamily)